MDLFDCEYNTGIFEFGDKRPAVIILFLCVGIAMVAVVFVAVC